MKAKKLFCLLLAICMFLSFTGCSLFDSNNELVSPPELTGEMYPIGKALRESAGNDYNLKYPTTGDRRSAIVLEDVDSDGIFEAFAFYSTNEDEMTHMHINIIRQNGDDWISVDDQTIVATGVEKVDFCDLNNNGTKEILIGWEVNGSSEKQLSVFSFENDKLVQKLQQPYTSFLCCDLDNNATNELFIHLLNTSEKTNKAIVYNYNQDGIAQTAGCLMDGNVKTASAPVLSVLSSGQRAIYIDEIKGVGAVTEVLYLLRGELVNPLLDTENSFENNLTLRAASLGFSDINNDGILEIPVATDLPNANSNSDEKLYYTNWCSFNGEKLSVKLITVVNTVDGYYITMPNSLVGSIAVLKDIDNHKREFYFYDAATNTLGDELFSIVAVELNKWESDGYDRKGMSEISRTDSTVFAARVNVLANVKISIDEIKNMFKIIE